MADRRQIHDIDQRRQVWSKINQLKSSCEELSKLKDDLSDRLSMLTDTVDKLFEEKRSGERNLNLKIDSSKLFQHNNRENVITMPKSLSSGNIDLAGGGKLSSSTLPRYPSDTFKIRLNHCLKEILPKADDILKLSEQVYPGKYIKKLIDIGANLTDPMFRGIYHSSQKHPDDFMPMLERAKESGVERMIITGGSLEDSKEALTIAYKDSQLFSTVGCHPTRCNEFDSYEGGPDAYLNDLRRLISEAPSKVLAIGELGLDYDRLHFCTKDTQKKYFERQLSLAKETNLPLFLHNRNSIDDFIEILNRNVDKFSKRGGVVHSFDGTLNDLQRVLMMGFYVGINGCSLKTEQNLEVAKMIPSDKLMIETDCPWCEIKKSHASFKYVKTIPQKCKDAKDDKLPVKNRNEPSSLVQILEVLSDIRNENIEQLAEQIWLNTNKLFFDK